MIAKLSRLNFQRRLFLTLAGIALLSAPVFGQQDSISAPSLKPYANFALRPVKSLTQVHPAVYEKFSGALAKYLDTYLSRWADAERQGNPGHRLIFEVGIIDAKFVSGQKRFWLGPIHGSSHMGARVELIDEKSGAVVARQMFRQAAGAMKGTFTMGASDNRMITALAQQAANYIISSYSLRPVGSAVAAVSSDALEADGDDSSDPDTVAASGNSPRQSNYHEELLQLDDLRQRGIITEEEFTREKTKILNAPR